MNGKIFHGHGLEELILLKCPYYPISQSQGNAYRNSNGILNRNRMNNPKSYMELQKASNSQSNLEKKE